MNNKKIAYQFLSRKDFAMAAARVMLQAGLIAGAVAIGLFETTWWWVTVRTSLAAFAASVVLYILGCLCNLGIKILGYSEVELERLAAL